MSSAAVRTAVDIPTSVLIWNVDLCAFLLSACCGKCSVADGRNLRRGVSLQTPWMQFEQSCTWASAAVYLNSSVFWHITQRRLAKHRRFGTTCGPNL
jgi:hypothetical protein